MRGHTHKRHIVKVILKENEKVSTDFHYISNANQYFCDLEKMGILKSRWGYKGAAKMKFRSIKDTEKAYLRSKKTPLTRKSKVVYNMSVHMRSKNCPLLRWGRNLDGIEKHQLKIQYLSVVKKSY